jgi:hypothetical protein
MNTHAHFTRLHTILGETTPHRGHTKRMALLCTWLVRMLKSSTVTFKTGLYSSSRVRFIFQATYPSPYRVVSSPINTSIETAERSPVDKAVEEAHHGARRGEPASHRLPGDDGVELPLAQRMRIRENPHLHPRHGGRPRQSGLTAS